MRISFTLSRFLNLLIRRLIAFAVIGIIIWAVLGIFFSKSGYFYEKGIIRSLNSTYQSKFVIVSKEGRNEDGYQVFTASPANDRSLVFTVERANGHIDGGLPLWRQLSDNYEELAHAKYYPLLVKKYFGIELRDIPMTTYSGMDGSHEPSDENYIEVTRANLDDVASRAKAFFSEAESHRLKKILILFKDEMSFSPEDANTPPQRFEFFGFEFDRGEQWESGFRPLTEEEIKQKMVNQIGQSIADRASYAFDTEYPDWRRHFDLKFPAGDLTSFEGVVSAHTATAEDREEALAEIYQAYTKVMVFVPKLTLNMTAIHLKYTTNKETETVTLKKEELSKVSSLAAMKELFNHSHKTVNPR